MTKVVSIQYPSGGFGHFIHVILSTYCNQFGGLLNEYRFGPGGDSHSYPTLLPKYFNNSFDITQYKNRLSEITTEFVTVLIDSGIDNDSYEFLSLISPDLKIRICYDDWSWPLLAKMFFTRCMSSVTGQKETVETWITPSLDHWDNPDSSWAKREKFFLYLRDHPFRSMWRSSNRNNLNLPVENVLIYQDLHQSLNHLVKVNNFEDFYRKWFATNQVHFEFYNQSINIINHLRDNIDITHITDLFTQSVVYYYIWLKYNFEIPHNDYSDWFTNTKDIVTVLEDHGVKV
jgi:hypothetical protein